MKRSGILIFIFFIFTFSQCINEKNSILTVVCMGDSLTESSYGNYPEFLQKIFIRNRINAKVISLGRPGNTSGEYLEYLERESPLKNIHPDIVILMLGTNDVRVDGDHTETAVFRSNIIKIRNYIKSCGKNIRIFIATIPPIFACDLHTFTKVSVKRVKDEIVPQIKNLSKELNLELIDINGFFYKNRQFLPGIHPTPAGYYKMAKFIFSVLRERCGFPQVR